MVFTIVLVAVTVLFLLVASYQDIRTREVPDWLSFGLVFVGIGLRGVFSFSQGWGVLLMGVAGAFLFYLVGWLFHATDQWGGGDTKLLVGMGAVLGFDWSFHDFSLVLFTVYLLFLGAIFGILWCLGVAIWRRPQFFPCFKSLRRQYRWWHLGSFGGSVLLAGGSWFVSPILLPAALFPLLGFYLFLLMRGVEDSCFLKKCTPEQLVEGDWLAEEVWHQGTLLHPKGTVTKAGIWDLITWKHQGRVNQVMVKEGIPFVPGFLLAYVALLVLDSQVVQWFFSLL